MKNVLILILLLFFHTSNSFCQTKHEMLEATCNCLTNVLSTSTEKVQFVLAHEECFKTAYAKSIAMKSSDSAGSYVDSFMELLSANCDSYRECHEILDKFTLVRSEIKVNDKKTCRQVMQVGDFEDTSGVERTIMSMRDSIQIMTFGDDAIYTKSKVIWKDDCTYNVVFIESTNSFENSLLKKGDERVIRVIDIIDNEQIVYEVGMFGRWFMGRVRKIK